MTAGETRMMVLGIKTGLEKAKALFQASTDARGGCKLLSEGDNCRCCLCLLDEEIHKAKQLLSKPAERAD